MTTVEQSEQPRVAVPRFGKPAAAFMAKDIPADEIDAAIRVGGR